jgi:hypothetical protein
MMATAGYSGTRLARKLGIAQGMNLCWLQAPAELQQWLAPLPDGLRAVKTLGPGVDLAHAFCTERARLERVLHEARAKLRDEAVLWISWPKKSAKVATDITEDVIRELALPIGFVDVKVCAVSEVWSGLKLVVRKELRAR